MRIIVLGSAAGGGAPQWNCRCPVCAEAWRGNPKTKIRSQSSVAVSAAGTSWLLLNASPDLRQQIFATPALQPSTGPRHSPIGGVFLTNGDVDHVAGLLSLRERQSLDVFGTATTLDILDANSLFGVLDPHLVRRHRVDLESEILTCAGLTVRPFAVPGKVPLYLEGDAPRIGETTESVVGLEIAAKAARFFYIPGCAEITENLRQRVAGAPLLFFDGTTFTEDEMQRLGLSEKTARRMGHVAMSGPEGAISRLAKSAIGRKIFIHINNTNPVLVEDLPEYRIVIEAGWEVAYDGMEIVL